MSAARDPADLTTLALCGALTHFGIQGLDESALRRLLGRYFPRALQPPEDLALIVPGMIHAAPSGEEFADLLGLLREHRRDHTEESNWIARAVASACAGENHLWQDMGLPDRGSLSRLIRHYFTALYHKNNANLRWKKFFYKQLCDRSEARLCKAPSCGVCSDYVSCFGPQ